MKHYTLALLLVTALAAPLTIQAQTVPPLMNVQARLAKPDGTPLPDGTYTVTLSLWDVATGGSAMTDQLWTETETVTTHNGAFAALLGKTTALTGSLFNGNLYLQIQVGSAAPLTPRQQLVSVAYAMKANSVANGSITGASIASGTITADKFAAGAISGWLLSGNAATNPATNFLGTMDAQPLLFRVNNQRVMRFEDVIDTANNIRSSNVVGGIGDNAVTNKAYGVVIAGGGQFFTNGQPSQPNTVDHSYGVITGGSLNTVMNGFGIIGGGFNNTVKGDFAIIAGGRQQENDSGDSFLGGGVGNYLDAAARGQFVGGGISNIGQGTNDVIGGGESNNAQGKDSVIGGGGGNYAGADYTTVAGGYNNQATQSAAFVGGGNLNVASNYQATVAGGNNNTASGTNAAIGGGSVNVASGLASTVAGGYSNTATGDYSFAAGYRAKAAGKGCFVWADSQASDFYGADNGFYVRAATGVRFNTNNAGTAGNARLTTGDGQFGYVHSNGTVDVSSYVGSGAGWYGTNTNHPLAFYTANSSAQMTLFQTGRLGIGFGLTGVSYPLTVNGAIYCTSFINASDARFKRSIHTLDNALDTVLTLRGVSYEWDKAKWPERKFDDGTQIGFIAQEVEKVLPGLVSTDAQGYKAVNYIGAVPVLVEAMKTQQKQIDAAKKENAELKTRLARLEAAVERMQNARK